MSLSFSASDSRDSGAAAIIIVVVVVVVVAAAAVFGGVVEVAVVVVVVAAVFEGVVEVVNVGLPFRLLMASIFFSRSTFALPFATKAASIFFLVASRFAARSDLFFLNFAVMLDLGTTVFKSTSISRISFANSFAISLLRSMVLRVSSTSLTPGSISANWAGVGHLENGSGGSVCNTPPTDFVLNAAPQSSMFLYSSADSGHVITVFGCVVGLFGLYPIFSIHAKRALSRSIVGILVVAVVAAGRLADAAVVAVVAGCSGGVTDAGVPIGTSAGRDAAIVLNFASSARSADLYSTSISAYSFSAASIFFLVADICLSRSLPSSVETPPNWVWSSSNLVTMSSSNSCNSASFSSTAPSLTIRSNATVVSGPISLKTRGFGHLRCPTGGKICNTSSDAESCMIPQ